MVKFKIPGNNNKVRMSDGKFYTGGIIYDNDVIRLPEESIKMFIIDDEPKSEVIEQEVETIIEPVETEPVEVETVEPVMVPVEEPKEENNIYEGFTKPEPIVYNEPINEEERQKDLELVDIKEALKMKYTVTKMKEMLKEKGEIGLYRLKEEDLVELLIKHGITS